MKHLVSIIFFFVLLFQILHAGDDADKIISQLQKKYEGMRDATISFTQKSQFSFSKKEQTFSGKLTMKKGNKYKIEVGEQTIITDGKTVWTYSKSNKQVLVNEYQEDEEMLTPDKIMTALPKEYKSEIIGKEKVGKYNTTIVQLHPKETSSVKIMKLWIDESEWLMRRIQIQDASSNSTTYTIDEMKMNVGVADSIFNFKAPDGVEVIDMR